MDSSPRLHARVRRLTARQARTHVILARAGRPFTMQILAGP